MTAYKQRPCIQFVGQASNGGRCCIWNFRGQMPRYSLHAVPRSCKVWHSRQGPSLQPLVLETNALPIELREYKKPPLESNQPCLHTRAALQIALRRPYENSSGSPPGLLVGAHPVRKAYTLARILRPFLGTGGCTCGLAGCLVHAPYGAKPWIRTTRRGRCAPCPRHSELPP